MLSNMHNALHQVMSLTALTVLMQYKDNFLYYYCLVLPTQHCFTALAWWKLTTCHIRTNAKDLIIYTHIADMHI